MVEKKKLVKWVTFWILFTLVEILVIICIKRLGYGRYAWEFLPIIWGSCIGLYFGIGRDLREKVFQKMWVAITK